MRIPSSKNGNFAGVGGNRIEFDGGRRAKAQRDVYEMGEFSSEGREGRGQF